jgi:hypothetical protein
VIKLKNNDIGIGCGIIAVTFILAFLLCFLYAAIGLWLWGAIMVAVFGLPALTYWQMFGLIILVRIIFPGHVSTTNNKHEFVTNYVKKGKNR